MQTLRTPLLDQFFIGVTHLGSEYFYFAALPFICTMLSRKVGIRIALAILASVMINCVIKTWVGEARPFVTHPGLNLVHEEGFGFPSGHAQQAALFWGLAALYLRNWFVVFIGALFVGMVGVSRVYLGVHYPSDVFASLVVAALILYNYSLLVKYGQNLWHPSRRVAVFGLVFAIAVLGCMAVSEKDMIAAGGLGSGLIAGLMFSTSIPPLSPSWRERFVSAAITAFVLLVVFVGLKFAFPPKGTEYYTLFSFVRYFACGVVLNAFPIYIDEKVRRFFRPAAEARPG
jgi:membrane-associated phospholipid phosphatase